MFSIDVYARRSLTAVTVVALSTALALSFAAAPALAASRSHATPATAVSTPAATSTGGLCYAKKDGKPSSFDAIDAAHTGSITMDQVTDFYKTRYGSLSTADKAKTTQDKYVANHIGYFKGIDKDNDGSVSCQEYQSSIAKLKAHKPAAVKPAAGTTASPVKPN